MEVHGMPDVFDNSGQQYGGAIAADSARIVFAGAGEFLGEGGAGGVGLITQNLSVNYTQQLSRIYEIGTAYTFLVSGRASGSSGIGRVLGPRPVQTGFYRKYGNACNAATNNVTLEAETGCGGGPAGAVGGLSRLDFILKSLVLQSLGLSINSNDMMIGEQLGAMFISLETT
jgi:hypothetical protein